MTIHSANFCSESMFSTAGSSSVRIDLSNSSLMFFLQIRITLYFCAVIAIQAGSAAIGFCVQSLIPSSFAASCL